MQPILSYRVGGGGGLQRSVPVGTGLGVRTGLSSQNKWFTLLVRVFYQWVKVGQLSLYSQVLLLPLRIPSMQAPAMLPLHKASPKTVKFRG